MILSELHDQRNAAIRRRKYDKFIAFLAISPALSILTIIAIVSIFWISLFWMVGL